MSLLRIFLSNETTAEAATPEMMRKDNIVLKSCRASAVAHL